MLEWLPCPLPGDLSYPGTELASPVSPALQVDSFTHWEFFTWEKSCSLPGKGINNILITKTNSVFQNKTKFNEKNGIVLHFCKSL